MRAGAETQNSSRSIADALARAAGRMLPWQAYRSKHTMGHRYQDLCLWPVTAGPLSWMLAYTSEAALADQGAMDMQPLCSAVHPGQTQTS